MKKKETNIFNDFLLESEKLGISREKTIKMFDSIYLEEVENLLKKK